MAPVGASTPTQCKYLPIWHQRIMEESELSREKKNKMLIFFKGLLVALLRCKPRNPISFCEKYVEEKVEGDELETSLCRSWRGDFNTYDFTRDTSDVFQVNNRDVYGEYETIRKTLDFNYHGNYSKTRQAVQDIAVSDVVLGGELKSEPWLVYTAGAMGAGKSHVIRWMSDHGYFPLPDIVQIDPDRFKEMLPEWQGYVEHDPMQAGGRMRKESGYLVEIAQHKAMDMGKNVWVDGSLRDGEWYARQLKIIKEKYPHYRVAIIHVLADFDIVVNRADERGVSTGRYVPVEEIKDSFERVPLVVEELSKLCDFVAHIRNNGGDPKLEVYCHDSERHTAGDWEAVRNRFATHNELTQSWSAHVHETLRTHDVVLFTKSYCSYCKKVIKLLHDYVDLPGALHIVELDTLAIGGVGIQLELGKITGVHTVPLLFQRF
eukprot:TRINITY_DN2532_c0_g1_i13.p1 TRINITY_DN2532_c0_g1~~TRINITY_DN2532_c0_g1_i13.p1  ORF type:complete len:468 (+),score=87.98 TRINITY_DN2532_c0_g1_i13:108-1406(+)